MRFYRTPIFIESITDGVISCIVGGIGDHHLRWVRPLDVLPESMQANASAGRVFFGEANLEAETDEQMAVVNIEDRWSIRGPLHFAFA